MPLFNSSSSTSLSSWQVKSSNYSASSGDKLLGDTTSGEITITLPASPTSGQEVDIIRSAGNSSVLINAGGKKVHSIDGFNIAINTVRTGGKLVYAGDSIGWLFSPGSSFSYLSNLHSIGNLEFDLDSRLLSGISGTTAISSFLDASASQRNFFQSTGSAQPIYTVDSGSRAFLRFNSSKYMDYSLSTSGSWTFYGVVANQRSSLTSPAVDPVFSSMASGSSSGIALSTYNSFSSSTQRKFLPEGTFTTSSFKKNGSTSNLNLSLAERGIFTFRVTGMSSQSLIRLNAFTNNGYIGSNDIYRFGGISRYLSDTDESTLINALNSIYSVF